MYRSLTESNNVLPTERGEVAPITKPEDHLIEAPIKALSIYNPMPLGLAFAALLVFASGVLGILSSKLPADMLHALINGSQTLSREALYPTQEKLVRPLGVPVASFIQGLQENKNPTLRSEP